LGQTKARDELAKGTVMSDEFHFNGEDDAKAGIWAAVRYLRKGVAGTDRGDIVREIIAIVNEVARGLPPGSEDPLDDGMPAARRGTDGRNVAAGRREPCISTLLGGPPKGQFDVGNCSRSSCFGERRDFPGACS
jgi:hypothetical protein